MTAASMLRGAVAGALRRHRPVAAGSSAAPFPLLRGGFQFHLHGAGSPSPPPPAAAAAMSTVANNSRRRHHLSTTKPATVPEQEALAKAELLRQMALEEASGGGRSKKMAKARRARTAAELAGLLRRQLEADAAAAPAPAENIKDRQLMLALLARSARAEKETERMRSRAARAERELEELRSKAVKAEKAMERMVNVWTEGKQVFGSLACTVVALVLVGCLVVKNI